MTDFGTLAPGMAEFEEKEIFFNRYSTTRAFYAQTPISLTLLIHFYSCSGTVAVKEGKLG